MNSIELEERLINFAVIIVGIIRLMPKTFEGNYYARQLLRSGNSPALNYGESQSAESKKDFIHKMSICLKELRETLICLTIVRKASFFKNEKVLMYALNECDELVSIFVKSIKTAKGK